MQLSPIIRDNQIAISNLENYDENSLKELIQNLSNENERLREGLHKRKITDYEVTKGEPKKQKTDIFQIGSENTLCRFLPILNNLPVTESSTIILYQEKNPIPLKFIVPQEALMCASGVYSNIFKGKNQMADVKTNEFIWNDPIEGPFYSPKAVIHLLKFAYALSRNFKPELSYKPLDEYEKADIDEILEDLLTLIHYYQIHEKLEFECVGCISDKMVDHGEIIETFALVHRYPLKNIQKSWHYNLLFDGALKYNTEQIFEIIESDCIKERGLTHTYSILRDILIQVSNILLKPEENEELYISDPHFFERYFQNVIQLHRALPESLLPGSFDFLKDPLEIYKEVKFPSIILSNALYQLSTNNHEAALEILDRILEENPKNTDALTNRGIVHYEMGNVETSLNDLKLALEGNSEDLRALVCLAKIDLEQKNYEKSLENLLLANKILPDNFYILWLRGENFYHQKNYEEALRAFKEADKINAKVSKHVFFRAQIYYDQGNYKEALKDLNLYIAEEAHLPESYQLRGLVNEKLGNMSDAHKDFSKALELNPELIINLFYRGRVQIQSPATPELLQALKDLQLYSEKTKENRREVLVLKGKIASKVGSLEQAWLFFKNAYEIEENEEILTFLGKLSFKIKKYPYALHILAKAYELNSKNLEIIYFYGKVLHMTGHSREALPILEQSLSIKETAIILGLLGVIYDHLGDHEKAYHFVQRCLAKDLKHGMTEDVNFLSLKMNYENGKETPQKTYEELEKLSKTITDLKLRSTVQIFIAEVLCKLDNVNEAMQFLGLATGNDVTNLKAFHLRGTLHRDRGQMKEALSDFSIILEYEPNNVEALRERAVLYKKMGKLEQARQDAEKLQQLDPQSDIMKILPY